MRTHIADAIDGYQWLDELQQVQAKQSGTVWQVVGGDMKQEELKRHGYKHDPYCDCGICQFCKGDEDKFGNPTKKGERMMAKIAKEDALIPRPAQAFQVGDK